MLTQTIDIPVEGILLKGDLTYHDNARGLIIFAHGSGSSRQSPHNQYIADALQEKGFATLLLDLLTPFEDSDHERRLDIDLLTHRLCSATLWLTKKSAYSKVNIGYLGASTGAASALRAAAELGSDKIKAVVLRGDRPDLATRALPQVKSPTLLLVGGLDHEVIKLNEVAFNSLSCLKKLAVIPGASHLFEEAGKLDDVISQASEWFLKYLYRYPQEIEKDFIDER